MKIKKIVENYLTSPQDEINDLSHELKQSTNKKRIEEIKNKINNLQTEINNASQEQKNNIGKYTNIKRKQIESIILWVVSNMFKAGSQQDIVNKCCEHFGII